MYAQLRDPPTLPSKGFYLVVGRSPADVLCLQEAC
jgi:hypothetical protein